MVDTGVDGGGGATAPPGGSTAGGSTTAAATAVEPGRGGRVSGVIRVNAVISSLNT